MLSEQEAEEFRICRLVEKWALTRDAGDWAEFASVWHSGAWMTATWFQGPAGPRPGPTGGVPVRVPAPGLSAVPAGLPDRTPAARAARAGGGLYLEGRDWRGGSATPGTPAAEGLMSPGPG
jgi:hypothetical protein